MTAHGDHIKTLQRADLLIVSMRYHEALASFELIADASDDLETLVLNDVLAARTYINMGQLELSADILAILLAQNVESRYVPLARLLADYVACCQDPRLSHIKLTLDHVESTYDFFESGELGESMVGFYITSAEAFTDRQVDMYVFYHHLILFHVTLARRRRLEQLNSIFCTLKSVIQQLISTQRFFDAFKLIYPLVNAATRYCIETPDPSGLQEEWLSLLTELAEQIKPNDDWKDMRALLGLEIVELHAMMRRDEACKLELVATQSLFEETGHPLGHCLVARLYATLSEVYDIDHQTRTDILLEVAERYGRLLYMKGARDCALTATTAGRKSGDVRSYLRSYDVFDTFSEITHDRFADVSGKVLLFMYISQAGRYLTGVAGLGTTLIEDLLELEATGLAALMAALLASVYSEQNRHEKAARLAQQALSLSHGQELDDASDIAFLAGGLQANLSTTMFDVQAGLIRAHEAETFLRDWIERDLSQGKVLNACRKLLLISGMRIVLMLLDETQLGRMKKDIKELHTMVEGVQDPHRKLEIIGYSLSLWLDMRMSIVTFADDVEDEMWALEWSKELAEEYLRNDMHYEAGMTWMKAGSICLQMYRKTRRNCTTDSASVQYLLMAQIYFVAAEKKFISTGRIRSLIQARYWRLHVDFELSNLGHEDHGELSLDAALSDLENTYGMLRTELTAVAGVEALMEMRQLTQEEEYQKVFEWAKVLALRRGDTGRLWHWCQTQKARSLANMLGLGIVTGKAEKAALQTTEDSARSLAEESQLEKELKNAQPHRKLLVHGSLSTARAEMRAMPELRVMSALGTTRQHSSATLVDWIIIGQDLYLLTVSTKDPIDVRLKQLSLTNDVVGEWTQKHWSTQKQRRVTLFEDNLLDEDAVLNQIEALVAPLALLTTPGELLLTTSLHTIPLHMLAIQTSGQIRRQHLIERNPLVYSYGSTVLHRCLYRAMQQSDARRSVFLATFHAADDRQREEQGSIYDHVERLGRIFQDEAHHGGDVTVESFPMLTLDSNLIHFHGHCEFKNSNALRHALVLHETESAETVPPGVTSSNFQAVQLECQDHIAKLLEKVETMPHLSAGPEDSSTTNRFDVEHVFRLTLASPHVTLVACESASQEITAGDEPLGLIAGFLCAGATSVLGTMWQIPSGPARGFSEAFYDDILSQQQQDDCNMVDLAMAWRNAVIKVKDVEDQDVTPYEWAGFALYGSWFHRRFVGSKGQNDDQH